MDPIAQIRERIDIVAFISEYLPVKKAGRNFNTLCPFHGEKSPSFVISPERQIWHCFGCSKGGDCYTFLMEYEHMDFPEALRFLAKKTGVPLETATVDITATSKKETIYNINMLASEFYHYILLQHPAGKAALAYLYERGIHEKLLKTFKLGYAPEGGKALSRYLLQKKKYAVADLVEAGLGIDKNHTVYDFFRGRLIFPLIDHRDNVLGFSGRWLDEANSFGGKYINTRDTLVYHKREHFFGLNVTKEAIRKEKQAILVEGEFDVMSCYQEGISNVVAVKGTALTEQQVRLLSRYAEKFTVCFDGDAAGQEAIKRSLPIIERKGVATTVIIIPGGKDPDESLKTDPIAFKKAVKQDNNIYDYLFTAASTKYSVSSPDGKRSIAEELLPVISSIENAIVKEHYLRKLSKLLETTYESITKELDRVTKKDVKEVRFPTPKVQRSREETLEEYLIALVLQSAKPKTAFQQAMDILSDSLAKERAYQKIIGHLLTYFETSGEIFDQKQFANILPSELLDAYNTTLLFPVPELTERKQLAEVENVAKQLRNGYLKERLKQLAADMKQKEKEGKLEELGLLQEAYSRYAALLKK